MRLNSGNLNIETPEGISFSYPLADPLNRCLAWVLDFFVIYAAYSLVVIAINLLQLLNLQDFSMALKTLIYFLLFTGYAIVTEWLWKGQTIGKRVMSLQVIDERGLKLKFHQILMRNLLRFIDFFPMFYMVGGLACLYHRNFQRIGDFASGTVVISLKTLPPPKLDRKIWNKFNSMKDHPHLASQFRSKVSPREAMLLLHAMLRRDELDPKARMELYRDMSSHFKELVKFPELVYQDISDEQVIKNMVQLVWEKESPSNGESR